MTDRDRFISICRALWGDEWYPKARDCLGVSIRTIKYWASESGHEPKDWPRIFISLLGACPDAMKEIQKRQQAIIGFKRSYSSAGR